MKNREACSVLKPSIAGIAAKGNCVLVCHPQKFTEKPLPFRALCLRAWETYCDRKEDET